MQRKEPMKLAFYKFDPDGENGKLVGPLLYTGTVDEAMEKGPPVLREYLKAVADYHGRDKLEYYLEHKCPPMALLYRGYILEVVDEGEDKNEP